jgi:hypothetical protein
MNERADGLSWRGGRLIRLALAGAVTAAMAGCMVGPDYHPPQPAAPDTWAGVQTPAAIAQVSVVSAQPAALGQW